MSRAFFLLFVLCAGCERPKAEAVSRTSATAVETAAPTTSANAVPTSSAPAAPSSSAEAATTASPYSAPALGEPDAKGRKKYLDSPKYDAASVTDVRPGGASPESAVVHYLASRVRGDQAYRQILTSYCNERCQRKRDEHDKWKFVEFRLESRRVCDRAEGATCFWVSVWFTISVDGKTESGTDQFEVVKDDDAWRILYVPT